LVRQDEITQLHRDNERLLTENRGTQRELSLLQEQLKQSNARQDQLFDQANRVDSDRTLLQERLRVAMLESQALKQSVEEQAQVNKSLEMELQKTRADLEKSLRLVAANTAAPDVAKVD
jgi:uncharacterized protein YdcH (DUF465 family)